MKLKLIKFFLIVYFELFYTLETREPLARRKSTQKFK